MSELLRKTLILTAVCGAALLGGAVQASGDVHIAILTNDSLTSTVRTIRGARKVIKRTHQDVTFHTFYMGDNAHDAPNIVDSLQKIKPTLILPVGSSATEFAQSHFKDVPIVFAGVKYPVLSGFVKSLNRPGENITGASLNVPVRVQFKYFKKIIPNLKRIGVLYTRNTASLIPQAKVVARQAGLTLIPIIVNDIKELPQALDSLAGVVQGIWGIADANLYDPRSTRYILLNTMRKGIPFMGFSRHIVESGALFALDFDYKAIGFQSGEIASRIIDGEKPADISVTLADVIWFHYNEKTAEHINVTIPEDLVAVAKEVYR